MKAKVLQSELAKGLAIVGKAVAERATIPVLAHVLLNAEGGRLKLAATDLAIGISTVVGGQIIEEGGVTLPAKTLTDWVNTLPPEVIAMALDDKTQTLGLECAEARANVKGFAAQEFPALPVPGEDATRIILEAKAFRQMIKRAVIATAIDETRIILTGVLVEFEDNQLTMAAADGFRLSVVTAKHMSWTDPCPETRTQGSTGLPKSVTQDPLSAIVPRRALLELLRISADAEEIALAISPKHIWAEVGDTKLTSGLIEGRFPDYEQIIPKSCATRTILNARDFLRACKAANVFARAADLILRLTIGDGSLAVSAKSVELGDNVGEVDALVVGDAIEIAFNAKYLLDVLPVVGTEQVVLETTTHTSPGVLKPCPCRTGQGPVGGDGFIHVIMPMHVSEVGKENDTQ